MMIILLTDFGQSEYVGIVKGVIYGVAPQAQIVDLCHDVDPQNIIEAAWILKCSYRYFPAGTIFCCVVDPGVGTRQKALAVKTRDYHFLAPDNGLLWETLTEQTVLAVRQIQVPSGASRTFHGRDVFAKAAARIYLGQFDNLREHAGEIKKLEFRRETRCGTVVRIDRFGNVITNLPKLDKSTYSVQIGKKKYTMNFYPTYEQATAEELFLIEGSCGTLEISLQNGSANSILSAKAGDRITIKQRSARSSAGSPAAW